MIKIEFGSERLHDQWCVTNVILYQTQHRPPDVPERWAYNGDVSLESGGVFIDISTWDWEYAEAVRVEDLGSAIGFDGAVLIEHVTINCLKDAEKIRAAVAGCGDYRWCLEREQADGKRGRSGDPARTKNALRLMIAEALLQYGHYDPDDRTYGPDNVPASETIQTDSDTNAPMDFDGWRASKRLQPWEDIFTYVVENHLQD